jgi:hypothetical protein
MVRDLLGCSCIQISAPQNTIFHQRTSSKCSEFFKIIPLSFKALFNPFLAEFYTVLVEGSAFPFIFSRLDLCVDESGFFDAQVFLELPFFDFLFELTHTIHCPSQHSSDCLVIVRIYSLMKISRKGRSKPTSERSHASLSAFSSLPGASDSEQHICHRSHRDEIPIFGASDVVLKAVHAVVASWCLSAEVRVSTPFLIFQESMQMLGL